MRADFRRSAQSTALMQEGAPAEPDEANAWANVVVMWGNLLYEASQMRAAVGREWRGALDDAVAKFRAAGCPEPDIRQALANHTQAEHLDLPPLEARPFGSLICLAPGRARGAASHRCQRTCGSW